MAKRRNYLDEIMAEHIEMPGCPQLIVTRGEAWQFLQELGYEELTSRAGYASIDYMVMNHRRKTLDLPLSDEAQKARVFAAMRAHA